MFAVHVTESAPTEVSDRNLVTAIDEDLSPTEQTSMSKIIDIVSREILDSRGNPTVEADVYLSDGSMGRPMPAAKS